MQVALKYREDFLEAYGAAVSGAVISRAAIGSAPFHCRRVVNNDRTDVHGSARGLLQDEHVVEAGKLLHGIYTTCEMRGSTLLLPVNNNKHRGSCDARIAAPGLVIQTKHPEECIGTLATRTAVGRGSSSGLSQRYGRRRFPADRTHHALGGAFVALADDATAAQSNPAGLYALTRFEAFVEYRVTDRDPTVVSSESGSLAVDPVTGDRDLPYLSVTNVSDPEQTSDFPFASLVFPFRVGSSDKPLAVFISRQLLLSDERSLSVPGMNTESRSSFESYPNTVNGGVVEAYSWPRIARATAETYAEVAAEWRGRPERTTTSARLGIRRASQSSARSAAPAEVSGSR